MRALGIVLCAMLAGCRGAETVALCETQARLDCELAFRCCSADERLARGLARYTSSESECRARAESACRADAASTDDAIALGRAAFDDDAAAVCLAAHRDARDACDPGIADRALPACAAATQGLVAAGGACAADIECMEGRCAVAAGGDGATHTPRGACLDLPSAGERCAADGSCARGTFCDGGRCERLPAEGDACSFACAPGLVCDLESRCAPQRVDGDTCAVDEECLTGLCASTCGGVAPGVCDG